MDLTSLNLELPSFAEIHEEKARSRKELAGKRMKALRRTYDAARFGRNTSDWNTPVTSINSELRNGLRTMRSRSRDLAHNDGYMKKFISMARSNTIGPRGIRLQVRAKTNGDELDSVLNRQVEDAWARWSHKENCTVSGKLSWLDAQNLAVTQLARDGECLIRQVTANNPFGFALKFIDVSYLDETYNNILPNGNRVLMSVEVDSDDQPVAYYLTTPYYDYLYPEYGRLGQRVRVPASEIMHLFVPNEDEAATRGVPWTHAAMRNLRELGAFIEAKVVGARVEACHMGMLIPPAGDDAYVGDEDDGRELEIEAQPGTFPVLPPGFSMQAFEPRHPGGQEGEFLKAMLKGVAVGFDVDYCTFTSDLREVNYSSIRAGISEVREVWKAVQQFLIEHLHRQVYLSWLRSSMMTGAIEGVLARDFARLTEPKHLPRGWDYINPLQDAQADELRVNNGFTTRTQVAADVGEDFEEILIELAEEKKLAEKYGIDFVYAKGGIPGNAPADPQASQQPDNTKASN